MRGRKPAPSNVIDGGFPGTPVILDEPEWLIEFEDGKWGQQRAAIAKERWAQLVKSMTLKQTLDKDNGALIEIAAGAYADWKLAEAHVAIHGPIVPAPRTSVPMHNPYKAIADAAAKRMQSAETALGIPPVERGRAVKVQSGKRQSRKSDTYLKPSAG
ncbi:P27 family phage terminase small subunit [Shinella sp.]|uniref:P27 family phage terminase small subunit n=1 Tax=Shinella sp. TaxID=1870904 RepID=UPI003F6E668A